jgi:hypothetical protein
MSLTTFGVFCILIFLEEMVTYFFLFWAHFHQHFTTFNIQQRSKYHFKKNLQNELTENIKNGIFTCCFVSGCMCKPFNIFVGNKNNNKRGFSCSSETLS